MKRFGIALALMLGLASCQGCHNPEPTPVTPSGAGGAPAYPGTCDGVCALGSALGCAWAQPTPKGATCSTVCANNQAQAFSAWDLNCRAKQTNCAAVDQNCQ